jgi:hypothetical protein
MKQVRMKKPECYKETEEEERRKYSMEKRKKVQKKGLNTAQPFPQITLNESTSKKKK